MRLDTANRSFASLIAVSLIGGMLAICGGGGCVLATLVIVQLGREGLGALTTEAAAVWSALAFIAIVGAGVGAAVTSICRQVRASWALARRMRAAELRCPPVLAGAARRAGLAGRVQLIDSDERFSFAYGALTPRVALSLGLYEAGSPRELDAVLVHERYHVRNLDPLKVLLARALPAAFFYIPALRRLHDRYVAGRELAADRRALRAYGRKPLAGALEKVLRGPELPELSAAAAIGGAALLDARLAQLESGREPRIGSLTARTVALSLGAAVALAGLFATAMVGFGGPAGVSELTGRSITLDGAVGAVLCAIPVVAGALVASRLLARRTRKPLAPLRS